MDNPFRPLPPPAQSNRRLWHLFLVAALGLSVLWLSWTLLLDDSEDSSHFQVESGKSFVDDEDAFEDTKILSQETRLRTRKEDLGEVEAEKKKIDKAPLKVIPEEEEEEDDDEHIREEDFVDEDTKMNEEGLNGGRQRTKKTPSAEDEAREKVAKPTQKEPVVHDEDEELSPEEIKRLAEEDHEDDEDEAEKPGAPGLSKAEQDAKKPEPAPETESSKIKEVKTETSDKKKAAAEKEEEDDEPPPPAPDDDAELVAEDEEDEEEIGEDTADDEEEAEEDDSKPSPATKPSGKGASKKPSAALEEDDEELTESGNKLASTTRASSAVKEGEEKPDESKVTQNTPLKATKSPTKKSLVAPDDEHEDDEVAEDDEEEITEDDEVLVPRSKKEEKKSSKPEPEKPLPLNGEDDEEEEAPLRDVDDDDEDEDEIEDDRSSPAAGKKPLSTASTKKDADEEDEENDDILGAPPVPEDEEEETEAVSPPQESTPATEKTQQQARVDSAKKVSPPADEEDEEEEAAESNDDEEDEMPAAVPPEKPVSLTTKTSVQNDTTSQVQQQNPSVNQTVLEKKPLTAQLACDSIRKRSDCDGRADCRWKSKSESTGFYCQVAEACTDPSIKLKSKCLSLPKCDWVRVSPSAYGCRDKVTTAGDSVAEGGDEPATKVGSSAEAVTENKDEEDENEASPMIVSTTPSECDLEAKKSKCLGHEGCSWVRVSSQPTKYGCRKEAQPSKAAVDDGEDEKNDDDEGYAPAEEEPATKVQAKPSAPSDVVEPPKKPAESTPASQDAEDDGDDGVATDAAEVDENPSQQEGGSPSEAEKTPCNTVRIKSLCQLRTDCYWKYPVSYSTGKYCTERALSISVSADKAQLYESIVSGQVAFADTEKMATYSSNNAALATNPRFKDLGSDWKRHKSDVSCALHPECMNKENVTAEMLRNLPAGMATAPPTYIRAQCCTQHPSLRGLFLQVVDFLNREGIPWWIAGTDLTTPLFTNGWLLPWTNQITIEFAVFGSKTAAEWAASKELRANLTSYNATRTRILRSTKNEFASKILQFNADAQHLPNTIRACAAKFVLGGGQKSSATSSYSPDWLKSERSGKEECYVVSKSSKIPSSKTPIYFLASHVDEVEDKGPSIKIIPRIMRTASADRCLEAWRPGTDYEPIPVSAVFPTVPCMGHGKFQGFSGVARCPSDAVTYLAWQSRTTADAKRYVSQEVLPDLEEFKQWAAIDYCSRGLNKP